MSHAGANLRDCVQFALELRVTLKRPASNLHNRHDLADDPRRDRKRK